VGTGTERIRGDFRQELKLFEEVRIVCKYVDLAGGKERLAREKREQEGAGGLPINCKFVILMGYIHNHPRSICCIRAHRLIVVVGDSRAIKSIVTAV